MSERERPEDPDPSEVQPTDNSAAAPVDLDRLDDLADETAPQPDA